MVMATMERLPIMSHLLTWLVVSSLPSYVIGDKEAEVKVHDTYWELMSIF